MILGYARSSSQAGTFDMARRGQPAQCLTAQGLRRAEVASVAASSTSQFSWVRPGPLPISASKSSISPSNDKQQGQLHMKNKRRIIGIVAAMTLALIGTVALVDLRALGDGRRGGRRSPRRRLRGRRVRAQGRRAGHHQVGGLDRTGTRTAEAGTVRSPTSSRSANRSPPATCSPAISCSLRAWRQGPGDRRGHRQGADLGAARSRARRRRRTEEGRPRRRLPARSIPSTSTSPDSDPKRSGRTRPTPRRARSDRRLDGRLRGGRRRRAPRRRRPT